MSKYVIDSTTLVDIADAIREQNESTEVIPVSNFATNIANLTGGFKYILLAYCETGTVITAEKGDMTYTGTSEGGTAVLTLPEGGKWMVYVGDSTDSEEVDFGDEITVVFTPAEAAYTTAQSGVTYNDDISALTEDELNTIAKTISNTPAITNTTTDVYYSGSVGDYHLFTSLTNRSTRNWTYEGQTTPMPVEIVGFNHYDLSDAEGAYGEATATGKAGIAWMWRDTSAIIEVSIGGGYIAENSTYISLLSNCVSSISKDVNVVCGGSNSSYPPKTNQLVVFSPCMVELNTTYSTTASPEQNLSATVFAGYISASDSNRVKNSITSNVPTGYITRDGYAGAGGVGSYVIDNDGGPSGLTRIGSVRNVGVAGVFNI